MAYKKTFIIGAKLLASELTDNFTILEPTASYGQTPARLDGGTAGALSNFQAVTDAGFKVSVDSVEYEYGAGNPYYYPAENLVQQLNGGSSLSWPTNYTTERAGNQFTTGAEAVAIKSVSVWIRSEYSHSSYAIVCAIRDVDGGGLPTGTVYASKSMNYTYWGTSFTKVTYTFDTPPILEANTQYAFELYQTGGGSEYNTWIEYTGTQYYPDNQRVNLAPGGSWALASGNLKFEIEQQVVDRGDLTGAGSHAEIASIIQNGLRIRGLDEVLVEYETDHYAITSPTNGIYGSVLALTAPTSGTSIIGATYLNMDATGGTEVDGTVTSANKVIKAGSAGFVVPPLLNATKTYEAPSPRILYGGTSPESLANFNTLMNGDNDGKIKAIIDGTVYEIDIPLAYTPITNLLNQTVGNSQVFWHTLNQDGNGQTINIPAGFKNITRITVYAQGGFTTDGTHQFEVWDSINKNTKYGETVTQASTDFNFPDNPIPVTAGEVGVFLEYQHRTGSQAVFAGSSYDAYASGAVYNNFVQATSYCYDLRILVQGEKQTDFTTYDQIATALETKLREVNDNIRVTYNTDHFEITTVDGTNLEILPFETPDGGTDLGAYFDIKENATEYGGIIGSANKMIQANDRGTIDTTMGMTKVAEGILTVASSSLEVEFVAGKRIIAVFETTGVTTATYNRIQINSDETGVYDFRHGAIGGALATLTNQGYIRFDDANTTNGWFAVFEITDTDGRYKFFNLVSTRDDGAQAYHSFGRYRKETARITKIKIRPGAGNYNIGTRLSVYSID